MSRLVGNRRRSGKVGFRRDVKKEDAERRLRSGGGRDRESRKKREKDQEERLLEEGKGKRSLKNRGETPL